MSERASRPAFGGPATAADPSRVVARGRIQVDARKALDKLRDHMLVDPHLWVCEIARVAVALGATRLDVTWDAENLVLDFDGRALAPDAIAHARDHILTPLDGTEGDALRALGIGVGAALSLDPAFVDVWRIEGESASRVRFERAYVDDEGFAPPAPAAIAAPRDKGPGVTMRVHARRRLGLKSIGRALFSEAPPELALLEKAIDTPHLALTIQGDLVPRGAKPLLTVDLDVPGTTRAILEVHATRSSDSTLDFCEHGVRLASYVLSGCWGLARTSGTLPIRVVVDAPRLPTNASRSQVRDDAELTRRVHAHVTPAFALAVAALREPAAIPKTRVGHVVTPLAAHASLLNGFGAIVAEVAHARRAGVGLPPEALALLDVPVLYDALGRPLALGELKGGTHELPLRVYEGTEPVPEALAPWLAGTVWLRGLPVERALLGLELVSAKELVAAAMLANERRNRALMHAASPPVVATTQETIHRESFRVTSGDFAGLEGEVAIGPRAHGRLATARLFVDERALELVTVTGVRLPVDVALAWPGRIVARFQYDAVERNEDLARALLFARRVAALAVMEHSSDAEMVRAAFAMWAETTNALGDGAKLGAPSDLAVWRTNDGRLVTFRAIALYARRTGAICYAKTQKPSPDGRIVLSTADLPTLRLLLKKATQFVPYDPALEVGPGLPESPPAVSVAIQREGLTGFVAPGQGRLRVYHAGAIIRDQAWQSRNGAVDIVLEDRDAIPLPQVTGVVWGTPVVDLAADEDALLEAVVAACERDVAPLAHFTAYLEQSWTRLSERGDQPALAARVADLPARQERARLEQAKAQVLARAPLDLASRVRTEAKRGSVAVPKKGAVLVTIGQGYPAPAEILFAGHPLGTARIGLLPVDAFVDVVDEAFVHAWTQLSPAGLAWAEGTILDASLDLASRLAESTDFADDSAALGLLVALYTESPVRADAVFKKVRWPTVQGTTFQLGESAAARWGVNRYEPWRSEANASPYDAPAVHLPITTLGELRRRVFSAAGITLIDVTEQAARLQALRSRGKRAAPPKLDGEPAHPLLRATFAELGATWIEGELELAPGPNDEITFVDADGVRQPMALSFGCPVRAVYRAEVNTFATVARELTLAAEQLVRTLVEDLPALPTFVRDRFRALLAAGLGRNQPIPDEDAGRAVFESTNARWYTLAELRQTEGGVRFTTDPPPYPVASKVLRLSATEAAAFARVVTLEDATAELRAIALGHARRTAPPRAEMVLDPHTRAQCMFFVSVDDEGVKGEIGLLHPTHATARRIELFQTRRPLVTIEDPEGWPIVAVLADDTLVSNVAFDGLANPKEDTTRIHRLVRRLVGASVSRFLPAPRDTLGVVRLPSPFLIRSVPGPARMVVALGVFWLPKHWPERPAIDVEAVGVIDKDRLPVVMRDPKSGAASTVVPACGRVWVTADARGLPRALEDVMAWVSVRLAAHVRAASGSPEVDAYRWDLALLGALDEPAIDPVAELATDRPDPALMRVAARRAPHLIDKATGDPIAPAPFVPAPVPADELDPSESAAPEGRQVSAPGSLEASAPESFFGGFIRRVLDLVSPKAEVPVDSPLTAAIGAALDAMALTGDPVAGVRETKRGRPVVYDRETRWVLVNTTHAVVKAHVLRPNGVLFLVLAALSEINRELMEVTDAEEVAKVLDLLRANASDA